MTSSRTPATLLPDLRRETRSSWDLLTPLALLALGVIGVAFIYSAQLSVTQGRGSGLGVWLRQEWFKQILFLGADFSLGQALKEGEHLALGQRAEKSVGRASASSSEFVCSDCV